MKKLVVAAGIVAGLAFGAPAMAQTKPTKPTIPIIVKDTTSSYWQTVLAGARKAGRDLGAAAAVELDPGRELRLPAVASHAALPTQAVPRWRERARRDLPSRRDAPTDHGATRGHRG